MGAMSWVDWGVMALIMLGLCWMVRIEVLRRCIRPCEGRYERGACTECGHTDPRHGCQ